MRRWTRVLAGLWAAALLAGILLAGTAAADEITIYQVAENDRMLDLPLEAMPTWIGSVMYVPDTVFDSAVTGVSLGVSYSQDRNDAQQRYRLTLYGASDILVFDLYAGTCVDGAGRSQDMRAVYRNGRAFVPLAAVCSFFGLRYSYTPTVYGNLIRITNGQEVLSTTDFVQAATNSMRSRYNEYMRTLNGGSGTTQATPSPTASPTATPTQSAAPDAQELSVCLAFQCMGEGGLDAILDTLDARGIQALFLFRPEALAANGDAVRRIVGSGHGIGLSVPGTGAEEVQAALEKGSALLEQLAHVRPHIVYLEEAEQAVTGQIAQAGWACWSGSVDARPAEQSQSAQSSALLRALENRTGTVRVLLDDSTGSSGALSLALPRMVQAGYRFLLTLETDL